MDYRKPAVFGQNWSPSRYQVLPYFAIERQVFARPDMQRILEIGCGNGWNMSRFSQYGRPTIGLDAAVANSRGRIVQALSPYPCFSSVPPTDPHWNPNF